MKPLHLLGIAAFCACGGSASPSVMDAAPMPDGPPSIRQQDGGHETEGGDATDGAPEAPAASCTFVQVVVGGYHTCALGDDGSVWCWGANDAGQLGDGTAEARGAMQVVTGLPRVRKVAVGEGHTCAIDEAGALWCWGSNTSGQSGGSLLEDVFRPGRVAGLPGPVKDVSGGYSHTCAVLEDQSVYCFGANYYGQCGQKDTGLWTYVPQRIDGVAAIAIDAGAYSTCALTAAGTLQCWGDNGRGQLGRPQGWFTYSYQADFVRGLPRPVQQVSAGYATTCAVLDDHSLWCWGDGDSGEIGIGYKFGRTFEPVEVTTAGQDVVEVGVGLVSTCARHEDGAITCWGQGSSGEIGDGAGVERLVPTAVAGVAGATALAMGASAHACALAGGKLLCWGSNSSGQLGQAIPRRAAPMAVHAMPAGGFARVSVGGGQSCALAAGGTPWCWGRDAGVLGIGQPAALEPVAPAGLGTFATLTVGNYFACGLRAGGGASCWGNNIDGELGDGTTVSTSLPLDVPGLGADVAEIVAGSWHVCARLGDGTVKCWGYNGYGGTGTGSAGQRVVVPTIVKGIAKADGLAAGAYHTCAHADGKVYCWGDNAAGQIGDETNIQRNGAVAVRLIGGVVGLAAGGSHTRAVDAAGAVSCWGANASGQLGDGTHAAASFPVPVSGLPKARAVVAGNAHTCALTEAGEVYCWGNNYAWQTGSEGEPDRPTPVRVEGTSEITVIEAGTTQTCALKGDQVLCWGGAASGALGDGTRGYELAPKEVASCK